MKKFILVSITLLFLIIIFIISGCDKDKANEPPKSGKVYTNMLVYPDPLPLSGGAFTVNITADWWGPNPANFDFGIGRSIDSCVALGPLPITMFKEVALPILCNTDSMACQTPNSYYFAIWIAGDSSVYKSFTWGDPNLLTLQANIEVARMPANSWDICNTSLNSVNTSFNNWNNDSNLVHVNPNFSGIYPIATTYNFYSSQLQEFLYMLSDYADSCRVDTLIYQYQLIFAYYQSYDPSYIGLSNNERHYQDMHNWSYVFRHNIDLYCDNHVGFVKQSVYNYTGIHELIHQIGNAFDSTVQYSDHTYHTGVYFRRCALNWPDSFENHDFKYTTNFYRICDRHITKLRLYLDNISAASLPTYEVKMNNSKFKRNFEDKYSIVMSLPKYSYKKFEPVIAKFELINRDNEDMNIYDLFQPELEGTSIIVTDNFGNKWSTNKAIHPLVVHDKPRYIIHPNDTFVISMPLNNWGQECRYNSKQDNDWYFDNFGYFPEGRKYKAKFYFDANNVNYYHTELESNVVDFEVSVLDQEDSEVLSSYKLNYQNGFGKFEEIIKKYPDNLFTEYIYTENLLSKYWIIVTGEDTDLEDLIKDYESFFEKYPNSCKILDYRFMTPYYIKCFKDKSNLEQILVNLKTQNAQNLLGRILANRNIKSWIKSVIEWWKIK